MADLNYLLQLRKSKNASHKAPNVDIRAIPSGWTPLAQATALNGYNGLALLAFPFMITTAVAQTTDDESRQMAKGFLDCKISIQSDSAQVRRYDATCKRLLEGRQIDEVISAVERIGAAVQRETSSFLSTRYKYGEQWFYIDCTLEQDGNSKVSGAVCLVLRA